MLYPLVFQPVGTHHYSGILFARPPAGNPPVRAFGLRFREGYRRVALADLLPLLPDQPWFTDILRRLRTRDAVVPLPELSVSARPYVQAAIAAARGTATLIVTSRPDRAQEVAETITAYLPPHLPPPLLWQAPEALPYEVLARDAATAAPRLAILHRLATAAANGDAPIIVAAAGGLMRPVMPADDLRAHTDMLQPGSRLNERAALARWLAWGYESVSVVEQPGQMARRGGILDIFPPTVDAPRSHRTLRGRGGEHPPLRRREPAQSGASRSRSDHSPRRTPRMASGGSGRTARGSRPVRVAPGDHRGVGAAPRDAAARRNTCPRRRAAHCLLPAGDADADRLPAAGRPRDRGRAGGRAPRRQPDGGAGGRTARELHHRGRIATQLARAVPRLGGRARTARGAPPHRDRRVGGEPGGRQRSVRWGYPWLRPCPGLRGADGAGD